MLLSALTENIRNVLSWHHTTFLVHLGNWKLVDTHTFEILGHIPNFRDSKYPQNRFSPGSKSSSLLTEPSTSDQKNENAQQEFNSFNESGKG